MELGILQIKIHYKWRVIDRISHFIKCRIVSWFRDMTRFPWLFCLVSRKTILTVVSRWTGIWSVNRWNKWFRWRPTSFRVPTICLALLRFTHRDWYTFSILFVSLDEISRNAMSFMIRVGWDILSCCVVYIRPGEISSDAISFMRCFERNISRFNVYGWMSFIGHRNVTLYTIPCFELSHTTEK